MNDPAVLFYTSDFLTGVIDMTMEERGQYITLLCYQHQKGHIKEETIRLLVGSCSVNVMKHFIRDEEGNFYNKRMDIEKEKRHNFTESRRENGKKGGRPKQEKEKPSGKPSENLVDNHKDNLMGNDNENININNKYYKDIELNNIFIEYLDLRKKLKCKNTDRAVKLLINELDKYDDKTKVQMISNSIMNSWKSVYPIKESKQKEVPEWFNKEVKEEQATKEEIQKLEERMKR